MCIKHLGIYHSFEKNETPTMFLCYERTFKFMNVNLCHLHVLHVYYNGQLKSVLFVYSPTPDIKEDACCIKTCTGYKRQEKARLLED